MKSLKTKVILSAVVLIFALVATIGSTFAWFTVSNTVNATGITLNITTADSLLVKVADESVTFATNPGTDEYNALNYTTGISASNFTTTLGWYLNTYLVQPATIVNATYNAIVPSSFNSIAVNDHLRPLSPIAEPFNDGAGYAIQLKFWVMTQSDYANLRLTSPVITANTGNETVNGQVANSMRMIVSTKADQDGMIYSNGNLTTVDYGYNFNGTINAADPTIADGATGIAPVSGEFNKLSQLTTWATLQGTMAAFTASDDTVIDTNLLVGDDPFTIGTTETDEPLENLVSNTPVLVFVTLYMEGWDTDTVNAVIGQQFTIAFNFSIA